jgi:CrcB protein
MINLLLIWSISTISVEYLQTLPMPVLVGVGGGIGAICRFSVDMIFTALGIVISMPLTPPAVAIFGTGVCGAFTTFSSHVVSIVDTIETGNYSRAGVDVTVTLLASLTGVGVGQAIGRIIY